MADETSECSVPVDVIIDENELSRCVVHRDTSTVKSDTKPRKITCTCTCPVPTSNYPFRDEVFAYIHQVASLILRYSSKYAVPPIAVAGGIADEYNTRFGFKGKLKGILDFGQDKIIPKIALPYLDQSAIPICFNPPDYQYGGGWSYCEYLPWIDAGIDQRVLEKWIQEQYDELVSLDPTNILERDRFKYWLTGGDYGKGNISLRTAIDLYEDSKRGNPAELPNLTRVDLLKYLLTDQGTAEFAALTIRAGNRLMAKSLAVLPARKQEAVLVTYYKQGPRFYIGPKGFLNNRGKDPANKIRAGEGCRTCYQRQRFAKELGIDVPAFWEKT